ncbi:MAG: GspH/FimT family pseudopilin [Burkholderiaceae bacterium]
MRGFTLVEMLVVLTISAILIAAAVPSFVWMNARTKASNASNDLLASMQLARSEAIRRNVGVTVCRVEDPTLAAPVCSGAAVGPIAANDWGTGWVVFAKTGGIVAGTFEAGDTVVKAQQFIGPASPRAVIESSAAPQFFSFRGDGMRNGGPIGITFSIDYRDPAVNAVSSAGRCMRLNMTGRADNYAPTAGVC